MEKGAYPQLPPDNQGYDPPPPYNEPSAAAPPPTAPLSAPVPPTVTIVVDDGKFGPYPKPIKCYHCGEQIMTQTHSKAGPLTWILCTALCVVGCFCGCCLIPFCITAAQDVMHKCPNCKKYVGSYERCKLRRN